MTTNNHEAIFAIVNAGYAEDAMAVAREQGARGGTIISGRGVAKENEAVFFGITIHEEKEILMIVVEKDIRDGVLHALYKQMGMQQKAQGIVFSLPVSDVAGLVQLPNDDEKKKHK
ncbi:MAG: P-II family nitrogen regulator [Clostridia bacterium]|nr:P-II family nitrogen regulator [Clostridia bacterium]